MMGLVAEIIFALRERDKALAGALPLLEFTLDRLFAQRDGDRLSLRSTARWVGVDGAIGTHSEEVFTQLPEADRIGKLGQVFLPLMTIHEETGEATRRRAPLDSLTSDPDAKTFIEALVKNRLLQTGLDDKKQAYLEIAHEALFHSWPRLIKMHRGDAAVSYACCVRSSSNRATGMDRIFFHRNG